MKHRSMEFFYYKIMQIKKNNKQWNHQIVMLQLLTIERLVFFWCPQAWLDG
jgi:membrane-associated HD superfamily phosphohydrolase